jgi:hypothetical protein
MRTTTSTIERLRHEIRYEDLSKTFQHAIETVRTLGLRYVWIDSLCIVQDSLDDLNHELPLMDKVYRYCYINIAATGASNGSEGCYWTRDPATVLPTEVSISWSNSEQNTSGIYHVIPDSNKWARKLIKQPLNRRCWVLQERILSPRVLHFGNDQLFWECRQFVACETYHRGLPACLRQNSLIDIKTLQLGDELQDDRWPAKYVLQDLRAATWTKRLWYAFKTMFQPMIHQQVTLHATKKSASVYRDWDAVVELYSMQFLTYPKDKLVAISGIANSISRSEPDTPTDGYLSGLWQSSLPAYLLWITEENEGSGGGQRGPELTPKRICDYVAPSWSWASIAGKISLTWCQHNYDPSHYLATLEHAEVSLDSDYRFGIVTAGRLRISAPIATVLWETENKASSVFPVKGKITHISLKHLNRIESVPTPPEISADSDLVFDTVEGNVVELVLLPIVGITKRSAYENEAVIGIILRRLGGGESFVRIGFFYTMRPQVRRILSNMPRQSVTIV